MEKHEKILSKAYKSPKETQAMQEEESSLWGN